jgi:hypothetical protein
MGLEYSPLEDQATQTKIEHMMEELNELPDIGYVAFSHTNKVVHIYQSTLAKDTRGQPSQTPNTPYPLVHPNHTGSGTGTHSNIQAANHIASNVRYATQDVDNHRPARRQHINKNLEPKEYTNKLETNANH